MKRRVYVWQEVTNDEYEFVLCQADSPVELSRRCGISAYKIERACESYRVNGKILSKRRRFVKVRIA